MLSVSVGNGHLTGSMVWSTLARERELFFSMTKPSWGIGQPV